MCLLLFQSAPGKGQITPPVPQWWRAHPYEQRQIPTEEGIQAMTCVYYNLSEIVSDYPVNSIFLCFAFPSAPGSHNPLKSSMPH